MSSPKIQRTPIDSLQRIVSSFKHIEKKIDKLQEDVNYHGHTLSELRVMVANLSAGSMTPDPRVDSIRRERFTEVNNTAIQYDDRFYQDSIKTKRKSVLQPFPSKIKAKSFHTQKYGIRPSKEVPSRIPKLPISPKNAGKHFARHRKAESPRKTMLQLKNHPRRNMISVGNLP